MSQIDDELEALGEAPLSAEEREALADPAFAENTDALAPLIARQGHLDMSPEQLTRGRDELERFLQQAPKQRPATPWWKTWALWLPVPAGAALATALAFWITGDPERDAAAPASQVLAQAPSTSSPGDREELAESEYASAPDPAAEPPSAAEPELTAKARPSTVDSSDAPEPQRETDAITALAEAQATLLGSRLGANTSPATLAADEARVERATRAYRSRLLARLDGQPSPASGESPWVGDGEEAGP